MDAIEAIITRRRIREYTDQKVDKKTLNGLCQAGLTAPSATNKRPYFGGRT